MIVKKEDTRFLARAAIIAAMYTVLTYLQNFLVPDSTSWAIQMRVSEALCVLAFFTPAAIPGLTLGCLIYNLSYVGALPMDWVVGTLATYLATQAMWLLRGVRVKSLPLLGLLMPAISNAILVGWELTVYIGDAFWLNAAFVAIGEVAVLLIFGTVLYYAMIKRGLDAKLFK